MSVFAASRGRRTWGGPAIGAHPSTHLRPSITKTPVAIGALAVALAAVLLAGVVPAGAASRHDPRYQVRRGETLSEIALRLGVATQSLAAANGIGDADRVLAGTSLRVPSGTAGATAPATRHLVRPGQHLSGIAAVYGLSVAALAEANGIRDPDVVVMGRTLIVPSVGSSSAGPTPTGGASLPSRLRSSPDRLALIPIFDRWAAHYGVPADLVKAVTWLESGWQNGVVSSTGAVGIGQLMPDTVDHMSVVIGTPLDPEVPDQNIRMSARFLRFLLDATGGRTTSALAGYYQGLASVARNGVYPSTLTYVAGVLSLRSRF